MDPQRAAAAAPEVRRGARRGAAPEVRRSVYPEPVERLIEELARLPGIGRRSAERLAFHILKSERPVAEALSRAITDVKARLRHCAVCWNLADAELCSICADPRRDHATVLVVEQPKDLIALEQTGLHRGVYHVLLGHLSPLDGIGPEDLTIHGLAARLEDPAANTGMPIAEVILGLNPTLEGDGTALHIAELARARGVRVSRLARGLPTGSTLEHANKAVLADALQGRQVVEG